MPHSNLGEACPPGRHLHPMSSITGEISKSDFEVSQSTPRRAAYLMPGRTNLAAGGVQGRRGSVWSWDGTDGRGRMSPGFEDAADWRCGAYAVTACNGSLLASAAGTTFAHAKADRVPIDYHTNAGIDVRLKSSLGIAANDDESLRQALGVDFRGVSAWYNEPKRFADIPDRNIWQHSGVRTRWIAHESGGYWDFCDFPLQNATLEEIEAWPLATADDYDYASLNDWVKNCGNYACFYGDAGHGDLINSTGLLRSMEQVRHPG